MRSVLDAEMVQQPDDTEMLKVLLDVMVDHPENYSERSLDHYEGYPRLYRKETVTVFDTEGRKLRVMAYVMNGRSLTPTLPSTRYFNGIREGFVQNGLPVKRLHMALNHVRQEVQEQRDALPPWYRSAKLRNPGGKER